MSIQARYSGVCPECGERWRPGDLIRSDFKVPGRYPIWTHAVCPDPSRIYVAGPMTGLPEYNYPAFTRAAATLRNLGYHVESPHEPGDVEGWTWVDYMRRGLAQMLTCDTIALLPGWHQSRGAMIELRLAEDLGMRRMLIDHDGEVLA